ncbi:PREDICTED: protein brambleberry-like [Branchiostoma belcheri]|uniref:Protein brambleberry-like n=1 Tax=Branchiostoma belcheri TaxID=7741 RepID=A0A6P4ZEB9_BRABE|nr:PREDICTED: protein brambleberry-like [Branchiostoma belcheri]
MTAMRLLSVLCTFVVIFSPCSAFFWPFSSEKTNEDDQRSPGVVPNQVPFEMATSDERFLMQAKQFELSPLDGCNDRIIAELKSSCGEMSEEEIAKLGVALLNCQSEVEGRPTFTCTQDMSLADCTAGMDSDTWNAYHIISNRARSVCYATRQQQFRRKTEQTVNKLVMTADQQVQAMESIKNGQAEIQTMAADTIQTVADGQERLMGRQQQLEHSQVSIASHIQGNLRDLAREKALIASGQRELVGMMADMTDKMKEKLESATTELLLHENDRKRSHEELLKDLMVVREKAQELWDKIDHNSHEMATFHQETAGQFHVTLSNLRQMNATVNYLLHLMDSMKTGLDKRMDFLAVSLGGAGDHLAILASCVLHVGYFLVAMVTMTFLQSPALSRAVMLVLVPTNAVSEVRYRRSLDFQSLTVVLTVAVVGNWLLIWVAQALWPRCRDMPSPIRTLCSCPHTGTMQPPPAIVTTPSSCRKPNRDSQPMFSDEETSPVKLEADMQQIIQDNIKTLELADRTLLQVHNTSVLLNKSFEERSDDCLEETIISVGGTPIKPPNTPMANNLSFGSGWQTTVDVRVSTPLLRAGLTTNIPCPGTPQSARKELVKRHLGSVLEDVSMSPRRSPRNSPSHPRTPTHNLNSSMTGTPSKANRRTPSTPRKYCKGITKAGAQCKVLCTADRDYCHLHTPSFSPAR